MRGFQQVTAEGTDIIRGRGTVNWDVAGDLTLRTPRLTAASGTDLKITTEDASGVAVGSLVLAASAVTGLPEVTDIGARLEMLARDLRIEGQIALPSGEVYLRATGLAGHVTLAAGSGIDVAGLSTRFDDLLVGTPGGRVGLVSDQGNVVVAEGAAIDVSGAAAGGDAGRVSLAAAAGTVSIDANQITGTTSASNYQSASFALDTRLLDGSDLGQLNDLLNARGFNEEGRIRLREGDIFLEPGDLIRARNVHLTADQGSIDVNGTIDASGAKAGRVEVFVQTDLTLGPAARLIATASGAGEAGGHVLLASNSSDIDIQTAASIDVSGAKGTQTGTVHLRAPRIANNEIGITSIAGTIQGAERIDAEAFKVYDQNSDGTPISVIDSDLIDQTQADAEALLTNTVETRLFGTSGDDRFRLLPGIEIRGAADLSLSDSWDLAPWHYSAKLDENGEPVLDVFGNPVLVETGPPGVLTLRAGGDLVLDESLSDSFTQVVEPSFWS